MATSEMLKRLMVLKLRKNADPKKLGERMAVIQAGYNCKIDETQKIAVVVSAAGKIYADTIQQETVRCEVQLVPVTAQRFIKAMKTIISKEEGTQAIITKMAETATTRTPGTKQL